MKNPKKALQETAAKAREMQRRYPFTRTTTSAGRKAAK